MLYLCIYIVFDTYLMMRDNLIVDKLYISKKSGIIMLYIII